MEAGVEVKLEFEITHFTPKHEDKMNSHEEL